MLYTTKAEIEKKNFQYLKTANCYKLCTLVQVARIMPWDSVLRFI